MKNTSTPASLLDDLANDLDLWREITAALRTAEHETGRRVPRVPANMKGMHRRAESLENIANALASRRVILYVHKGQARLRLPKLQGYGNIEMVLSSGVPQGTNTFHVNKKGRATVDLIDLQKAIQLALDVEDGDGEAVVRDEGAFLILENQFEDTDDPKVKIKTVILHLAYPARLSPDGTKIHCEGSREVGKYTVEPREAKPQATRVKGDEPVKTVPPIAPKVR